MVRFCVDFTKKLEDSDKSICAPYSLLALFKALSAFLLARLPTPHFWKNKHPSLLVLFRALPDA